MADGSPDDVPQTRGRRLDGWKEIAAYLGSDLSPRTAQRWESKEGLPVYRAGVKVFAYTDELDRWWSRRIVSPAADAAEPTTQREGGTFVRRAGKPVLVLCLVALLATIVWAIRRAYEPRVQVATLQWGR